MAKMSPVRKSVKKNNDQKLVMIEEVIEQVRELAWVGQHTKAIELASQTLSTSNIKIAEQMDLLDLRAESYIAIGKLDLAIKDAKEMGKIAKTSAHKAQALNRLVLIQMRMGDLKAAAKSANSALKASEQSKQKSLIAISLFRLGEAQFRLRQHEDAITSAEKAIALFQVAGDASGAGRAHWVLATALFNTNHIEESRRAAQNAMDLCQQAGDQYGVGNAFNIFSFSDVDLVENIRHTQQAVQAFERAGYLERQTAARGNLANTYAELGLYSHARRLYNETAEIHRRIGSKSGLTIVWGNLITTELSLGALESARNRMPEYIKLVTALGDPSQQANLSSASAELALSEGNPQAAVRHLKAAAKLEHNLELINEINSIAGLGLMHLANGDPVAALKATKKAIDMHQAQTFTTQGLWIWWRHTQALLANKKAKEAREAIERAYDLLLERITNVRDEGLRRNFLNKVEVNRNILKFWVADGTKRKLPKERLFAHLAIESNIREPFKRLADTGLRLNALHTLADIQTFLVEEATELSGGEHVMLILEKDGKREVAQSILPLPSYESGNGYEPTEDPKKILTSIHKYLDQARLTRTTQLTIDRRPSTKGNRPSSTVHGLTRIVAPLIAQNQVHGYLYVDMDSLYSTFDETDRDMLGMLANQGAVALDNAGLLEGLEQKVEERTEELNQRVDELAILNSVGEAMAKTLDVKTVVKIVGDKVQNIFATESVTIRLYDPASNMIQRAYDYDKGYEDLTDTSFQMGKGLTSKIIESGKPLVFGTGKESDAAGSMSVPSQISKEETESYMGVPIITGNKVIGVVTVQSYKQYAYNESHVNLLQTLASNMGVAIQNARLFEAEQQRVDELATLNSVGEAIAKTLDVETVTKVVGDKLRTIFNTEITEILLLDKATNLIHCAYSYYTKPIEFEPFPLGVGLTSKIINTRKPILTHTSEADENEGALIVSKEDETESYLGVPIIAGEEVIGVVSIQSYKQNVYNENHVRLLQTFSANMGVAIQNARLFEAEQERVAELQIINSIQQGLAAELDFQAIVDLVGDKLREVLHTGDIGIRWYDSKLNLITPLYEYEHNKKIHINPATPKKGGAFEKLQTTKKPLVFNTTKEQDAFGLTTAPGTDQSKSSANIPIIVSDSVVGYIITENHEIENAYGESEIRLLTTIAGSLGTALENARLFDETQRLFKAEQERVAELQIINSIQQGLAAELDFQAIVDLVGDKLSEVLNTGDLGITWYDEKANLVHYLYTYEHGKRLSIPSEPPTSGGQFETMLKTRQPVVWNTRAEYIGGTLDGTDQSKSLVTIPIISSDRVLGAITIENFERENAYGESELRLLTTIAASLGTALENARLFDETQRLFKAEQERVAELQIINSIQQGLTFELDFQAIVDLVGDQLREVFSTTDLGIRWYDEKANLLQYLYEYEHGERLNFPTEPPTPNGQFDKILKSRKHLVWGTAEEGNAIAPNLPGTDASKSGVSLPIISSDRVIGNIIIENYEHENAYGESEIRLLTTIAASLGTALENARLFKAEQERVAELQIINSIQQGLAAELDFQAIVDLVGDKLREVFNTPDLGINWYDEKTNLLHTLYSYEHGKRLTIEPYEPSPGGGFETMVNTRQPLVLNTVEDYARLNTSALPGTDQSKSLVTVPIISSDRVLGNISIENYERENAFGESELRLLTTIAASLGTALENARLFDETQRLFKAEQERVAELQIINSIQQGLAAELDFQAIVDLVGDKLREVLHTGDIGIRWYDSKANLLMSLYEYEHNQRIQVSNGTPKKGGPFEKLQTTKKPLVFNTPEEQDAFGLTVVPGTDQSKSTVYIPIIVSDSVVGYIITENHEIEKAYGESEIRLLTTIAASLGTALENARLFDETQRLLKITEERNAELAIINSVQHALAAELNIQGIYEAVGDKIREIFHNTDMNIRILDSQTNTVLYPYFYEKGERLKLDPTPFNNTGFSSHVYRTRETIVINENLLEEEKKYGSFTLPGTESENSVVFVPLVVGEQARGLINLASMEEHAFSDSDVRLLQTLANSMSVALENARLFDETQRLLKITEDRAAELAIINSVQEGLASKLDMQAIYELVGDKLAEVMNTLDIDIRLFSPETNQVFYPYLRDHGERIEVAPSPMRGFAKHIYETRQTVIINEKLAERMAEFGSVLVPGTQMEKSYVAVPILVDGQALGMVSISNYEKENAFDDSDVRLLQTVVSAMSVALENARLFDETQRLLKETETRAAELAILNSVSEAMAKTLDVKTVAHNVGDKIREIFNAEIIDILLYDSTTNMVQLTYSYFGKYFENEPPWELSEGGLTTKIIITRQPLLLRSMKEINEHGAQAYTTSPDDEEDIQSYMGVPIMVGDKVLGVVDVQSLKPNIFDENNLRLLQTLSSNMGIAIENARLFNETQRLLKETEERNSELAVINSVQAALSNELSIEGIYDAVGSKMREIFNAEVGIRIYDPKTDLMHTPYLYEKGKRIYPEPYQVSDKGFAAHVFRTRETLVVNENAAQVRQKLGSYLLPGTEAAKSSIYVPLMVGDQARGLVSISNYEREHAFNDSTIRLLQTLVNAMSVALENARLFDETERLLQETEERAKELAIINGVQADLSASMEMQAMYQLVGDKLQEVFDAQVVTIMEYDPQLTRSTWRYAVEKGEKLTIEPSKPIGFSKHIIDTRRMMLVNTGLVERRKALGGAVAAGQPAKSYLGVPLLINNQVRGVISLQNVDHENAFSESDMRLLQTLASSMSVALENARLLEETRRREIENSALLDISRDISSSLDSSTVLEGIANHAKNVLRGELSGLFLSEENGQIFRAIAAVGSEAENLLNDRISLGEGILGSIAKNKIGEIVNDVDNDPRGIQITGTDSNPDEHLLVVPLLANDDLKGLMAVWRNGKNKEFLDSELEFLMGLSRQAVVAIQNSQLFTDAQSLRIAAEQANHAKSAFMANMSHELRTPLNAIIGFTRIVRRKSEGILPEKQTENLDKVLSSSEHLLGLINTVLDIAKIEAGRMDVQASNFNINALIDLCANTATPLLKSGVHLKKQVDGDLNIVYSDQDKIKQIVLNLLSNAAKFTKDGNITLQVEKHQGETGEQIHVSVTDTGIGISKEAIEHIFEEFQQADSTTTREYGGTGLGLAISKNLANLLGGDLTVESEFGTGSTFTLRIPTRYGVRPASLSSLIPAPVQEADSTVEVNHSKKLILVIDDDPDAIYFLQESLDPNEFEVIGTRTGVEGQQKARELKPHAILLDILMPDKDGWQVLHDLKADKSTTNIPVILLTIVDKKALGFGLGAAAYLLKPLNPTEVLETLRHVIKQKDHDVIHVLAVDDDPQIMDMLHQLLPESEFRLESAYDGVAGLQAIEAQRPDVILLDIMMPKLDGFGVIEHLRADPELRNIPIIVISAKELTEAEAISLRKSVAFIMQKRGFDGEKLVQEINQVMHL